MSAVVRSGDKARFCYRCGHQDTFFSDSVCSCNVGWYTGKPNLVYVSRLPATFHARRRFGVGGLPRWVP